MKKFKFRLQVVLDMREKELEERQMEMSRILVPLNYVEGDNFEHDLAIRGNDMPVLTVLDNYKNVEYGSDEWKMVTVVAVRRLNKVEFALKAALKLASAYLD